MRNYKIKEVSEYFSNKRTTLDGFYVSMKYILNKLLKNIKNSNGINNI